MAGSYLHIAVAVVRDAAGRILISERKKDCVYAGQWEFPGGKVEAAESVTEALARELEEELGVHISAARPLIHLRYAYPDRKVILDTWEATAWRGVPESREGQRYSWVKPEALDDYPMLAANRPIVAAVQLPDQYLITPPLAGEVGGFVSGLRSSLQAGLRLVRLRQPQMSLPEYVALAAQCQAVCSAMGAELLVDRLEAASALGLGLHLPAKDLYRHDKRPLDACAWLAASCHNAEELVLAQAMDCDFVVLGAVQKTATHPAVAPLGWDRFAELARQASLPVYALGGMSLTHTEQAWHAGGQGIAAIRGLWLDEAD